MPRTHRGRPSSSVRDRVEQYACIDAKDLPPIDPSDCLSELTSESKVTWPNGYVQRLTLKVTVTRPEFGGLRQWYVCPACHRRVRKLYSPAAGHEFRCRRCYGLLYKSQYEPRTPL